jgi:hypothetical protein
MCRYSGFKNIFVPQRPLQRWLHLHLAELFDYEVLHDEIF